MNIKEMTAEDVYHNLRIKGVLHSHNAVDKRKICEAIKAYAQHIAANNEKDFTQKKDFEDKNITLGEWWKKYKDEANAIICPRSKTCIKIALHYYYDTDISVITIKELLRWKNVGKVTAKDLYEAFQTHK